MTIRNRDDQLTLDIGHRGLPFVRVTAKTSVTTVDMNYGHRGLPFIATEGAAPPAPNQPDGLPVVLIIAT